MPAEDLPSHRRMGEQTMRITVVGAILIVAGVIVVARILESLLEKGQRRPQVKRSPAGPAVSVGSLGV